ncbi:MAG: 50S ribosomal protein L3 N(5)-glutamine methyltransferase [Burkholderiales bacterium]
MFAEAASQLSTLRDWLRFAVSRFNEAGLSFGHGSTNAYDEAAYLLLHALHLPIDRLEPFLDARLTKSEIETVELLLARRIRERIPAAYLTREAWLREYRFYVDERVIVPRSPIAELLLDERLAPWIAEPAEIRHALDLCTGSGCLAILVALAFTQASVDATEISAAAMEVANKNIADYQLAERVRVTRGDLFGELAARYDLIVANPPYVDLAAMRALPAEYRAEPALALDGGADGLDVVRRILAQSGSRLTPQGLLVVEIGHQKETVEAAFPTLPFIWLETAAGADQVFLLQACDLSP